ncbi:MAG: peptidylprolyl isomerase [Verrucomicrobiales bacterium]|nr:peptidylprolyl isomerase [Verrucomicrobiales bacterium]MCP5558338.1 peptidylprolyl isomerase [Verrucomicrobiaceae bacterium]
MKRFPWRFAVYLIVGLYLFCDLRACHGPLSRLLDDGGLAGKPVDGPNAYAAIVYGTPITRLELEEAIRDHLWARGEKWGALSASAQKQTRWLVAERLINDRMIRAFRIMNGLDAKTPITAVEAEEDMLKRQFTDPANFAPRLQNQQMTAALLSKNIQDSLDDQAWIEEKISKRMAEITDETARQWFSENKESVAVPERWQASHLYLTRHEKDKPDRLTEIQSIHDRIVAGEITFDDACSRFSDDARSKIRSGDLGWFSAERMPEDFITSIRALPIGEVSAPIATKLGWHLVKVIGHEPARDITFEEVREEVLAHLKNERRALAVQRLTAELRARSMKPTQFIFQKAEVIDASLPAPEVPAGMQPKE